MSQLYWGFIFAVGLIAGSSLSAQEPPKTALEGQPETQSGENEGATGGEDQRPPEQAQPIDISPALKGIESAIRELEPDEDDFERQERNDRERRDLEAQENMAFWAKAMTWATVATVLLTLAALIAIIRTLHHTKRAADAADLMVNEAKSTTVAAMAAAKESERQADIAQRSLALQHKPWLGVRLTEDFVENMRDFDSGGAESKPARVLMSAVIMIENISQWPARISAVKITVDGYPDAPVADGLFTLKATGRTWINRVAGQGFISSHHGDQRVLLAMTEHAINDAEWVQFKQALPSIGIIVRYSSTLGNEYEAGFSFRPTHVFGGQYFVDGGKIKNYDREIPQG